MHWFALLFPEEVAEASHMDHCKVAHDDLPDLSMASYDSTTGFFLFRIKGK